MYPKAIRDKVLELFDFHQNYAHVADILRLPKSSVRSIVTTDTNRPKKKRGKKFLLNSRDNTRIKRAVRALNSRNERASAAKLKSYLELQVSVRTIQRALKRLGFAYKSAENKIELTKKHKQQRLELAEKWLRESHPWTFTIFSDEKKFNFDGPDSWSSGADVDRKICRNKRQMGGGSIMVWAALLSDGSVIVERISGRLNADKYIEMLDQKVMPTLESLVDARDYIFQQDNARPHVAKKTLTWLKGKFKSVLEWPARSPDLNPVDNL